MLDLDGIKISRETVGLVRLLGSLLAAHRFYVSVYLNIFLVIAALINVIGFVCFICSFTIIKLIYVIKLMLV